MMNKYVLATVLLDKAKTLLIIEPLHFSFKHLYCSFVLGSSWEPLNYAEYFGRQLFLRTKKPHLPFLLVCAVYFSVLC